MELRLYGEIIKRRLWLVVGLLLLVLLSYALWPPHQPTLYTAQMRFAVGIRPEPGAGTYYTYDRYYTWLTAEYLVDDLAEVVKSQAFAQDIAQRAGLAIPAGAIQGATAAGKLHRILSVSITWPNAQELERIAQAVVATLTEGGLTYFAQLGTERAAVALIDPPAIGAVGRSLRQRLDLPLRLILALAAGVALAFLLDYLDTTVRHRADLESLGLPILAEIPCRQRWWARLWRRRPLP
jgi:capsular polysaccharide biosynthesis protein